MERQTENYDLLKKLPVYASIHCCDIPLNRDQCARHLARVLELSAAELARVCDQDSPVRRQIVFDTTALLFHFIVMTFESTSSIHTTAAERGKSIAGVAFIAYCYNMEILRLAGEDQCPTTAAHDYAVARRMRIATASHPIASYSQHDVLLAWRAISDRCLSVPAFSDHDAWQELIAYRHQLMLVTAQVIVGCERAAIHCHAADESSTSKGFTPTHADDMDDEESNRIPCVGSGRIDIPSSDGLGRYTSRETDANGEAIVRVSFKYIAEIMQCAVASVAPRMAMHLAALEEQTVSEEEMTNLLLSCLGVHHPREMMPASGRIYRAWLEQYRSIFERRVSARASAEGDQLLRLRVMDEFCPPHIKVRYVFDNLLVQVTDRSRITRHYRPPIAEMWLVRDSNKVAALELADAKLGYLEEETQRSAFLIATFAETLCDDDVHRFDILDMAASLGYRGAYRDVMPSVASDTCSRTGNSRVNAKMPAVVDAVFSTAEAGTVQLGARWRDPPISERNAPAFLFYTNSSVLLQYRGRIIPFVDAFEAAAAWLLIILDHHKGVFTNDAEATGVNLLPASKSVARALSEIGPETAGSHWWPPIERRCKELLKTFTITDVVSGEQSPIVRNATSSVRFVVPEEMSKMH